MKTKSLKRFLLAYFVGTGLVVVVIYTFLVNYYFFLGLETDSLFTFEQEAKQFDRHYQENPDTPLPRMANLSAYLGIDALPSEVLTLFPARQHRDRRFLEFHNHENEIGGDHPVDQVAHLCAGEHCELLFFYRYKLYNGEHLYLLLSYGPEDITEAQKEEFERWLIATLPLGAVFIMMVVVGAVIIIRKVAQPIHQLAVWADGLDLENIRTGRPTFPFHELTTVAERLQSAFNRMGGALEHEQQFLRNASHELRTPLAVMANNLELMKKLNTRREVSMPEQQVLDRIGRAVLSMQQLTETLLWLSREESTLPEPEPVALDELVQNQIQFYEYLLDQKNVQVNVSVSRSKVQVSATACRIVVANLIRNAFQYTADGQVEIGVDGSEFRICNVSKNDAANDTSGSDYGFGLGLTLVEQITERMRWAYTHQNIPGGRECRVDFGS